MNAVLIVGASKKINDRLEELLTEHKATYHTTKATNLTAALNAIEKEKPAIILVNNNLPEKDVLAVIMHYSVQNGTADLIVLDDDNADKTLLNKMGAIHIIDIYHEFDILPELVEKLIASNKNSPS